MVTSEHLNGGTLALVDTDPVHLARMTGLARRLEAWQDRTGDRPGDPDSPWQQLLRQQGR